MPGPAGTHPGSEHGLDMSVMRAAAIWSNFTVGEHGGMRSNGKAGCADGVATGAAGCIGAWQCGASCITLSPIRAAGFPAIDDALILADAKTAIKKRYYNSANYPLLYQLSI